MNESTNKESLSIKEFLGVIKWVVDTYMKMAPWLTTAAILSRVVLDLRSLAYALIFGKILDKLIFVAQQEQADISDLYPYLLGLLVYYTIAEGIIDRIYNYANRSVRHLSRNEMDKYMFKKIEALGVQAIEDPEVANLLQRAEEWINSTFEMLNLVIYAIADLVRVVVAAITVIAFFPLFLPIVMLLSLIKYFPDRHFNKQDFEWQVENSEGKRKARWSSGFLKDPKELAEINIVGAQKYLSDKYEQFYDWYNKGLLKIFRNRAISSILLNILDAAVGVAGYAIIFNSLILGKISVGTVAFQMKSLDILTSSIGDLFSELASINDYAIKMKDLVTLFNMEPKVKDGAEKLEERGSAPQIEFVDVSFKYPNSEKYVFENLNLKINSGEKLAIVGHNGAGKTTLVKLIARIYSPEKGKILVNGIDLASLKINDWYRNIGVLFQEYNFYGHLTARENIILGRPQKKYNEEEMIAAAKNADAHEFIMEFPNQYETTVSERFKGGLRPSSGQQQKIAIARFFYRNAPLAIFDEPTAAIDAVSEYKIFNKIYDFFREKSVIIISHRFSTVRNADRIIVMDKGKIIESGTHSELLAKEGVYATAYKLQAEGYKD